MAFDYKGLLKVGAIGAVGMLLFTQIKSLIAAMAQSEQLSTQQVISLEDLESQLKSKQKDAQLKVVKLKPYYFQPVKHKRPIRSAEKLFFEPADLDVVQIVMNQLSHKVKEKTKPQDIAVSWFAENSKAPKGYSKVAGFGKIKGDFFEITREFEKVERLGYWKRFRQWINKHILSAININSKIGTDKNMRPFLLGPVIGYLNYQVALAKDTRILAICRIEDGQIIPEVTAVTRSELLNYMRQRVQERSFYVGLLVLGAILVGRWLWSDIKRYINVLKVRKERMSSSYFNPKDLISDDKLCIICYANCRNIIFFDCRHMIMCRECSETYDSEVCPYCKLEIDDIKVVHSSK